MKQTGFIYESKRTDYVFGFNSPLKGTIINESGDWKEYKPSDEKQYADAKFDTMSCVAFSFLNVIETQINYFIKHEKLTQFQLKIISDAGFLVSGKFNCSDRFNAILSGTTTRGNTFQKVGDSVRHDGLIPEQDFPFGGNNWSEYHNPYLITDGMKKKAKKIFEIFEFNYEWIAINKISGALKECPLGIAIPSPNPSHAVELIESTHIFDTYPPYLYTIKTGIGYAMKVIVKVKKDETPEPKIDGWQYFKLNEKTGRNHTVSELDTELVDRLDIARGYSEIPYVLNSGYRTESENTEVGGVENSAHMNKKAVDIRARNSNEHFLITMGLIRAGFTRISKKYPNHIHVDISTEKPQNVLF